MKMLRRTVPLFKSYAMVSACLFFVSCASTKKGPDYITSSTLIATTTTNMIYSDGSIPTYAVAANVTQEGSPVWFQCDHPGRIWILLNPQQKFRDVQGPMVASIQAFDTLTEQAQPMPLRQSPDAPSYALMFPVTGSYKFTLSGNHWEVEEVGGIE